MKKPAVLIAHPSPDLYGSDLQMVESVAALVGDGFGVTVVLPSDGPLRPRLHQRGAATLIVSFPVLRRAQQSPRAFLIMCLQAVVAVVRIVLLLLRRRPRLVYVNTITLPWWLLAAKIARIPALCHLHEAEGTDRSLVQRALFAPLLLAGAVVVISEASRASMVAASPRLAGRAVLIYNGVPGPPEGPVPARRGKPFRAVVVGRLSPRKAPHVALDAVAQVRTQGYDVQLDVIGTAFPGYEDYVEVLHERAARSDLVGAVRFLGYRSPVWSDLDHADVLLAPSLREPFGNAVVEAQLARRPVVASASLGHLESITDEQTGLLVPPNDPIAMAAALQRLIDDPELARRLSETAAEVAARRFAPERYAREIAGVARRLTASTVRT